MKVTFFSFLALIQTALVFGQDIESNKYYILPHNYNAFVKDSDISWAYEMHSHHLFEPQATNSFNIHSYLINAQKSGKIKSYLDKEHNGQILEKWAKGNKNDDYIEVKKSGIMNLNIYQTHLI